MFATAELVAQLLDILLRRQDVALEVASSEKLEDALFKLLLVVPEKRREKIRRAVQELRERYNLGGLRLLFLGYDYVGEEGPLGITLQLGKPLPEELADAIRTCTAVQIRLPPTFTRAETYHLVEVTPSELVVSLYITLPVLALLRLLGADTRSIVELLKSEIIRVGEHVELHPRPIKLRPYQEEAISKWLKKHRGIVVLPTGAGKTIVGIEIIKRLGVPTLVLVPTRDLVIQWRRAVRNLLGVKPGTADDVLAGRKPSIVVTTYQRLVKWLREKPSAFLRLIAGRQLIICDEVHHVAAKTFLRALLSTCPLYVLGLTATPERSDKNEEALYPLVGGIVVRIPFVKLAEEGYLAPVLFYLQRERWREFAKKKLEELERELRRLEEQGLEEKAKTLRAIVRRLYIILDEKKGLFALLARYHTARSKGDWKKARKILKKIARMLSFLRALWAVDRAISEAKAGHKVIVFTRFVRDLVTVYSLLKTLHNYEPAVLTAQKFIPQSLDDLIKLAKLQKRLKELKRESKAESAVLEILLGKELTEEAKKSIEEEEKKLKKLITKLEMSGKLVDPQAEVTKFATDETRILIATPKGEEGIDLPDADTAVFQHIPHSLRVFLQRIGRITRPKEGKVARAFFLFFDLKRDRELERQIRTWIQTYFPQDKMREIADKIIYKSRRKLEELKELLKKRSAKPPLECWEIAVAKLRPYLPWIDRWFRLVLKKDVRKLTKFERYLLLLMRLILADEANNFMPIAVDIRTKGKNVAGTVLDWIKDPRRFDIPGLDTPEAWDVYKRLKKLIKRNKLDEAVDLILKFAEPDEVEKVIAESIMLTSAP